MTAMTLNYSAAALKARLRTTEQGADTALWLGTTRPPLAPEGGIWLDRVRDGGSRFTWPRSATAQKATRKR